MIENLYLRKLSYYELKKIFEYLGGALNGKFFVDKNYIFKYIIGSECSDEYMNTQIDKDKVTDINYICLNDYEATGLSFDYNEITDLSPKLQIYMSQKFGQRYADDLEAYRRSQGGKNDKTAHISN